MSAFGRGCVKTETRRMSANGTLATHGVSLTEVFLNALA
ncbi:MAG: hypothetical protein ACI8U0_002814, partial [Flavobacteriales bacterium]